MGTSGRESLFFVCWYDLAKVKKYHYGDRSEEVNAW